MKKSMEKLMRNVLMPNFPCNIKSLDRLFCFNSNLKKLFLNNIWGLLSCNCPVLTSLIIVADQAESLGASRHRDLTEEVLGRVTRPGQLGGGETLSLGRDYNWAITGALSLPLCHDICHVSRGGGVCSSWHYHHHRYNTGCLLTITTVTVTRDYLQAWELSFTTPRTVTWYFCN